MRSKISNRARFLAMARVAGYHDDVRTFTRLVIESRISREHLDAAWWEGVRAKLAKVPCTCRECNRDGLKAVANYLLEIERENDRQPNCLVDAPSANRGRS